MKKLTTKQRVEKYFKKNKACKELYTVGGIICTSKEKAGKLSKTFKTVKRNGKD